MSVHMIGQPKGGLLLVMIMYTSKMGYTFYSTAFHILLKYFTVLHNLLLAWHTSTLFRTFFILAVALPDVTNVRTLVSRGYRLVLLVMKSDQLVQ